ncbi:MAG: bacillithiol biosynthesis cysteine-adding enzyme BshC [Gemmatimonadales bacterium]
MSLTFHTTRTSFAGDPSAFAAVRDAQAARRIPAGLEPAFLASGPAQANLDALLSGRALAVTTGQQAGLFTGPLYTVLKALTAVALAERLAKAWQRPVVPVFWVAGDDHDFAEIAQCDVVAQDGSRAAVRLRERGAEAPMLPAYRETLGVDATSALERLEGLLPPSEFRSGVMAWLRAAYRPERSMAEAHGQAMAALLGEQGVVVLRGWSGGLKRAASGVVAEALRRAGELDGLLAAEAERLLGAGRGAPVEVGNGLALVLVEGSRGRDRLRVAEGGGFVTRRSGERFDLGALETLLRDDPERLSANVLLRPVVEAAVVPTVAYVGGPGELAYLPQTAPLFAVLGVPRPVSVPRLSGFVVEARTRKTLDRFGLSVESLARPEQELAGEAAREALPASATGALAALRASLEAGYAALAREAGALDRTLERPVESARNQALGATHEIEKKLVAAAKRANETALQQLLRARVSLYPDGHPQERVYTAASFLARYGSAFVELLLTAAREHAGSLLEARPREP